MRYKFVCAVLVGIAFSIAQASEPILYKGFQWETTPSQLMQKYPNFFCKKDGSREVLCLSNSETYFNKRANNVFVVFIDSKLKKIEITLNFSKNNYAAIAPEVQAKIFFKELRDELTKKYGKEDDPPEIIKSMKLANLSFVLWSQKEASIRMSVVPNEKTNNGDFMVEVEFAKSGYHKLQEDISRNKKSKDL